METVQWQPIETAPKDGTRILVCENDEITLVQWGYDDSNLTWIVPFGNSNLMESFWGGEAYYATVGNPTHWMPLPELPKR